MRSGEDHVIFGAATLLWSRAVEANDGVTAAAWDEVELTKKTTGGCTLPSSLTMVRTRLTNSSKKRSEMGRAWPVCNDISTD